MPVAPAGPAVSPTPDVPLLAPHARRYLLDGLTPGVLTASLLHEDGTLETVELRPDAAGGWR